MKNALLELEEVAGKHEKCKVKVETIYVTSQFEPDPTLKNHTDYYLSLFQKSMELVNK